RFEVVAQNAIPEIAVRVFLIRDRQLSACYTLFVMEPPAVALAPADIPDSALDNATQQAAERLRDAAQRHDQQLAELNAQFEKQTGHPYEAALSTPAVVPDQGLSVGYERERKRIDDEYEQVLRAEFPAAPPWAALVPGARTGSWEDLANAANRAILDADVRSAIKTLSGQIAGLDDALGRLLSAPRLAASGPNTCSPAPAKR
ncbi:MAG TPA: hypothetical protein VLV86_25535, partial [Vicinamibacterales bacterium]|nr:hypothetical protein [Vicinamibacterales bacterium]